MGADIKFAVVLLLLLLLLLPLPVPVVVLVLLLLLLRGMKIWIRVICFCWLILYVSCSFVHQAVHSGHTQRRASLVQQFPEHLLSWPSTTLRQQPPFPIPPKQAMATAKDWVERVEYEDYVEYREVPVDKIIEASLPMDLSAVGDNLNTDLALEPPPWWPMMIYDDLRWSMRFDEWSMMIYDDAWWSMMIHDYRWQSIMIHDDLSMIHDDRWWSMMTYDNLWGSMMIHDDLSMIHDDRWWSMIIYEVRWWSMMIYHDSWWPMMIYDILHVLPTSMISGGGSAATFLIGWISASSKAQCCVSSSGFLVEVLLIPICSWGSRDWVQDQTGRPDRATDLHPGRLKWVWGCVHKLPEMVSSPKLFFCQEHFVDKFREAGNS